MSAEDRIRVRPKERFFGDWEVYVDLDGQTLVYAFGSKTEQEAKDFAEKWIGELTSYLRNRKP
jgi:hypothetical protein